VIVVNETGRSSVMDRAAESGGRSIFISVPDGLRLHVREYGPPAAPALPVVCLPGLTRTVADFAALAPALADGLPPRRVIAIDSRGRGQSDYDPDPRRYNVAVELADVIAVLNALKIQKAVFIGSSRGGILTMLLAAANPAAIAGAVLHDIGPVIEPEGLARIKGYVGRLPRPRSLGEAAEILRRLFEAQFPKLTSEQWLAAAGRAWKDDDGVLAPTYDVQIANTITDFDSARPLPPLWKEFDALVRAPILVIHGANSDILSAATVSAMRACCPGLESIEVPDQGHVPLLEDAALLQRIAAFIDKCERAVNLQKG
jgi:pimeloyl-ACP methyl ester carboxylesterase